MNTSSKERTRKYRQNKKLKELNQQLKEKDILRGEKLTSKREVVLLRENIKLKGNEPKVRFKAYINKLIRFYYDDAERCFFFTLCYSFNEKMGHVANAFVVDKLKNSLVEVGAVKTMIIIPEYHKTKNSIHNHGIIRVAEEFRGDIQSELQRLWVDQYRGSMFITLLNANKRFEEYLTKFVQADESRLYNFNDGLVTEGIDFNAIDELKVSKPVLKPIKPVEVESKAKESPASDLRVKHAQDASIDTIDVNQSLLELENAEDKSSTSIEVLKSNQTVKQRLLDRAYYWYSIMFILYLKVVMRV